MKLLKTRCIRFIQTIAIVLIVSMLLVTTANASDDFTLVSSDPIAGAGGKMTDGSYMYCTAIDYDNDGDQDFLSWNGESGASEAYWFYRNDGSGSFTEIVPNVVFPMRNGHDYVVVDIDNDSDEDILVPNGSDMSFYRNDGTGSFALDSDPITSAGGMLTDGSHVYCTTIDYDNDGDQDFLSWNGESGASEAYWFYRNDGSGNFTETVPNVVFPMRNGYSYVVVDFDNDGDEDILVPNGSDMSFYRNDGTGSFALHSDPIVSAGGMPTDGSYVYCTAIDFDIDGDQDFLSWNGESGDNEAFWFYKNDGSGNFTETVPNVVFAMRNGYSYIVVDIDNDGDEDMLVPNGSGLSFYRQDGTAVAANTDPSISTNNGLTLSEGATSSLQTHLISTDTEQDDTTVEYTVTSLPSNGEIKKSGVTLFLNGTFTQAQLDAGSMTYVHDGTDTTSDSFIFKVSDGVGGELTGQTFNITVNAVDDDAPTISTNDGLTLDEGAIKSLKSLLIATDTEQNDTTLTYTVTDIADNGWLKNNGATLLLNGSFTQAQLDAGSVTYTHDGTNTTSDSFTFKVSDGPNELTGQTFYITVNAVDDDAPTISKNDGITLDEGASKSLKSLLIATDTEQNDTTLTYTVTDIADNGWLKNNGATLLLNGSFTQAQLDAGSVTYTHDGTNTTSDSFTFKVSDGPNELTNQTFNITVNAVDDNAPTISKNDGLTVDEGATKSLKALLIATDTEQNDATLIYTVTSLPQNGSLTMATFSQAQLDAGNVKYTHDGTNTTSDSFTFKVSDGPNELTGQTFNITVNAVDDDAPTISKNDGITLDEGAAKSLKALLIATDTEQNDATLTYTVTSLPSNGSLTMATFSQAQLDSGNVKYTHNGSNTTSDSFTFKVSDGANELSGQTFSITINPVDDPPAPTPEPTPEPTPTPNPTEQRVTVTGTLLDDDGKPLAGYTVELHSTPRTTVTDSKGRYTFTDVEVADHSLIVKENDGSTLKSFAITVKTGDDFAWSKPDDNSITAVVQEDTASIDVTIKIADDGTVTVNNIENIVNPQTGDVQRSSVWVLVIVGALIISTMLIMKRKQLN